MNAAEYRNWVRQYAKRIGLAPDLAESVWQQESSGSLDTALKGPALSRGRGNAIGPWQVVPAYHPNFPVNGDLIAQGRYAMNYLKEVGPARYYGTGQAPAGQPTTQQYVQQVMSRAGRPDVRMAADTTGSTDTDRTPSGDPVTGRMLPPRPTMPTLPPFPSMAPGAPEEAPETSWATPITALLAGLAMGRGSGLERVLSGAAYAGTGLAAADKAENELLELKQKRADAQRKRRGQDALDQYADMLSQNPETAELGAMIRMDPGAGMRMYADQRQAQMEQQARQAYAQQLKDAGATDYQVAQALAGQNPGQQDKPAGPAQYGLAPKQYVAADGKTVMERVYASDGSFVDRVLPGAPIAYDPETARDVAQGRAAGTAVGTASGKAQVELPSALATADQSIAAVDEALAHPGRAWATGTSSVIPRIPGLDPKDYELKLGQIKGAAFLQAFEALKGGGQITEVEGQKATQAISDLDLAQSEAAHEKSLKTLRDVLVAARNRLLKASGRQPSAEPATGTPPLPPGFRLAP